MGSTIVERIARNHMVVGPDRPLRPGDFVVLEPRHVLTHDNTSAVMAKFDTIGAPAVRHPRQPVVALDHDIQNRSRENLHKYDRIRAFCRRNDLDFHPPGTGIGHQVMLERGYALPGSLVVASDSHANMYGAVGALGTPVVRTDAAAIWATGEFWWEIPPTVQVVLEGELRPGVTGKDVILTLCGRYRDGEVLNTALEFGGPGVASLDLSARMTIANMTTEWGALGGWFPVDAVTLAFLRERMDRLERAGLGGRITPSDLERWERQPPAPDPDARYRARITLDLYTVEPALAGPHTVQVVTPVAEAAPSGIRIHKAYLLSCVNGRLEDLEEAARRLRGRKVAEGVELYVAAASREVQDAAEASGAWATLLEAGAIALLPGCGPCIGLGQGLLGPGEVGISATNRNFRGRMGSRDAEVYLANPGVVAASAVAGRIVDGDVAAAGPQDRRLELFHPQQDAAEAVDILPGFPDRLRGRLVFIPRESLDTDGIYGKDHTYRELTREQMAAVVMENHDPTLAERLRPGDIVVGTRNFGTGSSREQAVTALQAAGVALVVAASISRTYQRNAFNNGFVCIECPSVVERLEAELAGGDAAAAPTLMPGDELEVDFAGGLITWRGEAHPFVPLGAVPQGLVVAGGVEATVRRRLAQRTTRI